MEEDNLKETVERLALINALSFKGKAREKSVLGRLLAERPDLKSKVKEILPIISEVVEAINKLSIEEQRALLSKKWPKTVKREKAEEKRGLPPLPNVERYEKVVTRFAPNPDCVLHLGSARAIILSHEYAKMYNGKFILRFDDTDPRLKRSAIVFMESIRKDLIWLGCRWDEEYIQSDRIPIYYSYAEDLLRRGCAYICTCQPEDFRRYVSKGEPCPCREASPERNMEKWRLMLDGTYGEGEAVLRIKTDLNHPNPAIRDWPAFRIIDPERYPHPRVGSRYRVWPLYNFACGIDDHLMGVTHIIRGKEHLTNQERQKYLYAHLGWKYPEAIHYGRLKIVGASLSKSEILKGVKSGLYKGWDDPRLATFAALRRRGITPEAIRQMILDLGPRPADITISWENLYAYNRKIIDPIADRFFFVQDPISLTIKKVPREFNVKIPLHPSHRERGFREFKVKPVKGEVELKVSRIDMELLKKNSVIRLIELFNIEVEGVKENLVSAVFHSESYNEAKKLNAPLIHWIPSGTGIPCYVVMPDGSIIKGVVESSIRKTSLGVTVQFERFGFVKVDKLGEDVIVYYAHR